MYSWKSFIVFCMQQLYHNDLLRQQKSKERLPMEACELKGVNNVFIRDNKAFPQRSITDILSFHDYVSSDSQQKWILQY